MSDVVSNMYGTREEFAEALSRAGLTVEMLVKLKEVELRMLQRSRTAIGKAYRASEFNSDEEEGLECKLAEIKEELANVKDRLHSYKNWFNTIKI